MCCPPPIGPKFSQFHAVFRKIWQNRMLAPPLEGWPPPTGNPGFAPERFLIHIITLLSDYLTPYTQTSDLLKMAMYLWFY